MTGVSEIIGATHFQSASHLDFSSALYFLNPGRGP